MPTISPLILFLQINPCSPRPIRITRAIASSIVRSSASRLHDYDVLLRARRESPPLRSHGLRIRWRPRCRSARRPRLRLSFGQPRSIEARREWRRPTSHGLRRRRRLWCHCTQRPHFRRSHRSRRCQRHELPPTTTSPCRDGLRRLRWQWQPFMPL